MTRLAVVFGIDVLVSFIITGLWGWAPWLDYYGFSPNHPQSALDYFYGLVFAGSLTFVGLFLVTSCILFVFSMLRSDPNYSESFLREAFYGDFRRLTVKYSALFVSILSAPAFYRVMWDLNEPREIRILGGFAMTMAAFLVLLLVTDWRLARPASRLHTVAASTRLRVQR
jgi:hypothetical protein